MYKNTFTIERNMTFNTTEIVIAIVISAITGAVASLVAPWANWGVEKKKKKLTWRKGFVDECKRIIEKKNFDLDKFKESSLYSNLKHHLSIKLRKEIEIKRKRDILGKRRPLEESLEILRQEQYIKNDLFGEIAILERKWGLL